MRKRSSFWNTIKIPKRLERLQSSPAWCALKRKQRRFTHDEEIGENRLHFIDKMYHSQNVDFHLELETLPVALIFSCGAQTRLDIVIGNRRFGWNFWKRGSVLIYFQCDLKVEELGATITTWHFRSRRKLRSVSVLGQRLLSNPNAWPGTNCCIINQSIAAQWINSSPASSGCSGRSLSLNMPRTSQAIQVSIRSLVACLFCLQFPAVSWPGIKRSTAVPLDERFNLFSQCICAPSPPLPRHDTCAGCARAYVRAGWRSAALQPRRENMRSLCQEESWVANTDAHTHLTKTHAHKHARMHARAEDDTRA